MLIGLKIIISLEFRPKKNKFYLQKIGQEAIPTSWTRNNQDGGLFFFILPIIISKHPVSRPITKLTRMDRTEEVKMCQKRKLRTTG